MHGFRRLKIPCPSCMNYFNGIFNVTWLWNNMGVSKRWKNLNTWVNYPFNLEECKETHERTFIQSPLDTHTVTHRSTRQQLCGHVRQGPCCQWYAAVYGLTTASQTESSTRTTSCPEHRLTKTWLSLASAYQNHTLFLRWMEIWLGSQTKSELVDHITMKNPTSGFWLSL